MAPSESAERERGAVPRQKRALVGERESRIGILADVLERVVAVPAQDPRCMVATGPHALVDQGAALIRHGS